jgi:dihydrofolate synthase/folylpolyglutamate synthase
MTFEESIEYLSGLGRYGWKLGLERIQALCAAFDHPERKFRSVHVGGSNGKGSTSTMIASILQESGFRTGLYLSPYVNTVRERVQVNGGMIPETEFARLMTRLRPVVEEIAGREGIGQPTEFEVKTMLGFLYFAEQACEFVVAEVGLGGRYDATNVLFPEVSVITNVTLDHTERLGNTVAAIAGEKSGIVKEETPCVTGATGDALKVIAQQCHDHDATIWRLGDEILCEADGETFAVSVGHHKHTGLRVRMKGEHQMSNAALAVGAIDQLIREHVPISETAIRDGLLAASLPGRFEIVREKPTLILDGAHNPAKAEALAKLLQAEYPGKRIHFVIGAVKGHDVQSSMSHLLPLAGKVIAAQPQLRRVPAETIAEIAKESCDDVQIIHSVPDAVRAALDDAGEDDVVCVTGSFYVVGEAGPVAKALAEGAAS